MSARAGDTVRTKAIDALRGVPWPVEFSFRILATRLAEQWARRESEAAAAFGSLAIAHAEARLRQDFDALALVAGDCVGLTYDRPGAGNTIQDMVTQAQSLLQQGAMLDFRHR